MSTAKITSAVDDPGDAAPLEELAERLDVGGHAAHERPAAFLRMVGDRQAVDVAEGPRAQPEERVLPGAGEPPGREHRGDRRHDGDDGADQRQRHDAGDIDRHFREALVDDLLHEHRDHDAPGRPDAGEQDRQADALAQLGARPPPAPHDRPGRSRVPCRSSLIVPPAPSRTTRRAAGTPAPARTARGAIRSRRHGRARRTAPRRRARSSTDATRP